MSDQPLADLIIGRLFDQFQDGLRVRWRSYALEYELTYCEPTDNPAMRLDFSSQTHVGRVTAWASGACDLEVIDARDGRTVMWEHHDLATDSEFHDVYPKVPVLMRDLQGRNEAG
jgi:hypothetical protein